MRLTHKLFLSLALLSSLSFADDNKYTIGFSQIGNESIWRAANSQDIQESALEHNIDLIFDDANEKQANQVKAIDEFIKKKVDLIAFVPIVKHGFSAVLKRAKEAKIPVLIVDRDLDVDRDLYVAKIGTDSYTEGKKAFAFIDRYVQKNHIKPRSKNGKLNIVILQGTKNSSVAILRDKGFREGLELSKNSDNYNIYRSIDANFSKKEGYEVMHKILAKNKDDIDILFAHNDDMALGAIKAIEDHRLRPGQDIIIVSCDGVRDIFEMMIKGKSNATVECNPLQGDLFIETALKIINNESVPEIIYMESGVFDSESAKKVLSTRKY